jgi:hypothetical protein
MRLFGNDPDCGPLLELGQTVQTGRQAAAGLLDSLSDADVFLTLHRQERSVWGGECGDPECVADMLLAEQRRAAAAARSPLDRVLNRGARPADPPALLLPMADEIDRAGIADAGESAS